MTLFILFSIFPLKSLILIPAYYLLPYTLHLKLNRTGELYPMWQHWREEGGGAGVQMACRLSVNDLEGFTCCLISAVWVQIWLPAQEHQGHFSSVSYNWDKRTCMHTENVSQSAFLEQHKESSDDKVITGAAVFGNETRSCYMPSPRCRLCPLLLQVCVSLKLCFSCVSY